MNVKKMPGKARAIRKIERRSVHPGTPPPDPSPQAPSNATGRPCEMSFILYGS